MLNPSAERELTENYRLSTEKARQWWNNQAFESRKNIVIESDAVINDDQEVEDQIVADVADSDYDELPDETKQEIDSQIDEEEGIEEVFEVQGEEYLQCSKCDDLFTSNEDYDIHKSVDHGEEPEDLEESDETYQLAMNPDLTREALREANSLLTETEERELYGGYDKTGKIQSSVMPYNVPAKATGKYNDNPNSFFYSNKIFRNGSSTERNSALGEARAKASEALVYAKIFKFSNDGMFGGEIQLVAEGKNKKLTEEESLRIKDQYNMKTESGGYSGYVDESEFGIGESKAREGLSEEREQWVNARNEAMMGNRQPFIELVRQGGGDVDLAESVDMDGVIQQIDMELENFDSGFYTEAKATEDGINWEYIDSVWDQYFEQAGVGNNHVGWLDFAQSKGINIGDAEFKWNAENYASYEFHSEARANEDAMPFDPYTNDYHKGWQSFNMDVGADGMIKHSHPSAASNINMAHRQFDANPTEWNDFHNQFEDVYEPSPVGVTKDDFWTNQEIENTKGLISGINPLNESKSSEDDYEERAEWNWLTNKDPAPEVDYGQVDYEDDGVSDISVPNAEPKDDKNEFLDDVDIKLEEVNFVYPTKSNESTKSYITGVNPYEEEYEEFEDSDEEIIEETISIRKLTGYSDNSIAQELHINYGVSHEEALEKVYSVEVSTNDKVAQTFFGKMYKECTESEKDELRMYSGSD
jgi:hypothetical protein